MPPNDHHKAKRDGAGVMSVGFENRHSSPDAVGARDFGGGVSSKLEFTAGERVMDGRPSVSRKPPVPAVVS